MGHDHWFEERPERVDDALDAFWGPTPEAPEPRRDLGASGSGRGDSAPDAWPPPGAVRLSWATWGEVCDLLGGAVGPRNPGRRTDVYHDACGEDPAGPFIELDVPTRHGPRTAHHGAWIAPDGPGWFALGPWPVTLHAAAGAKAPPIPAPIRVAQATVTIERGADVVVMASEAYDGLYLRPANPGDRSDGVCFARTAPGGRLGESTPRCWRPVER